MGYQFKRTIGAYSKGTVMSVPEVNANSIIVLVCGVWSEDRTSIAAATEQYSKLLVAVTLELIRQE